MASMGAVGDFNPDPIIRRLRGSGGLVNRLLQQILQAEGLPKHGVKAELQDRIAERLRAYAQQRNAQRYVRLTRMIENPREIPAPGPPPMNGYINHVLPPVGPPPPYSALPQPYSFQSNMGNSLGSSPNNVRGSGYNFEFKDSPFFQLKEQIGVTRVCDAMQQHRHTVSIEIKAANHPILSRVANDPTLKVMVFCSGEAHGRQDIAFPHQSEIKVNGGEIRANLRGLKGKPGSTRPADITSALRLKLANYANTVDMTYALTSKAGGGSPQKFYLVVYIVQSVPVSDLVSKLEGGKRITKDRVIQEMVSKARDTDIVATSTVLSLKCPLSTLRIDLPCRSMSCRHNQCFDATSYMQLQEQGPTWLCPICNFSAPFDTLAVDEYVRDILKNTSKSTDQVTIEPQGSWKSYERPKEPSTNGRSSLSFADDDDDDDDLVEIVQGGQPRLDTPAYRTPSSIPMPNSREPSAASSVPVRVASGKRPVSAVIDLTSSGDEDEEPVSRAPKRQQTNGFGPAIPDYRG
ncbi:hypothetical protein BP5796_08710 [Coleophoma crateriformis]|uniref:E3 SUMO-protein ligase pli1 n=1 Tax=Coleophoma crateriformis TaxID=565419 RepID=A0A3D8R8D5_9HELO|nr:hypothetical protein BP5796_08710 [Coleophoma crateriformis]